MNTLIEKIKQYNNNYKLAKLTGLNYSTIYNILKGKNYTHATEQKILKILEVKK